MTIQWDKALFIVIPVALLFWCLKYCCDKRDENISARPRTPSPFHNRSEYQTHSASYSPYSQRRSQIGFGLDINEPSSSNPYRPLHQPNSVRIEALDHTEVTTPYPLTDSMAQPSNTSTHPVPPYPLSNMGPMPLPPAADEPPSYAEATQTK